MDILAILQLINLLMSNPVLLELVKRLLEHQDPKAVNAVVARLITDQPRSTYEA